MIRIGVLEPFHYKHNKEPPKIAYVITEAPILHETQHQTSMKESSSARS